MSKGSKRRPQVVSDQDIRNQWDIIFGKKEHKPQPAPINKPPATDKTTDVK